MTLALRDVNVSAQGAASFLVLLDLSFCFSLQRNERALFLVPQERPVNCKANSLSLLLLLLQERLPEKRGTHTLTSAERIMIELRLNSDL